MEAEKPQGPKRTVLAVSSVLLCIGLVGVAYVWPSETPRANPESSFPAASTLQPLIERCDDEPEVKLVDGLQRTICTSREHPPFMIYIDAGADAIERVGLMVPVHTNPAEAIERNAVGFELFSMIAGAPSESFLPREVIADVGLRPTRFVRDGLVYATQSVGGVGLVFSVAPNDFTAETE